MLTAGIVDRLKSNITKSRLLYTIGLMTFFYALYEGMVSYIVPILITQHGFTNSQMGMIIASSSVAGAIFDFILSKYLTNTHYRRLFLIFFLLCFLYPAMLWFSKSAIMFLLAMFIWGIYFDLNKFAMYDFVSRKSSPQEFSSSFSLIGLFRSLGILLGPLIIGFVVTGHKIDFFPFLIIFLFLSTAFLIYSLYVRSYSSDKEINSGNYKSHNVLLELKIWKTIGTTLLPVLLFNLTLLITDATFWTLGPLFSSSIPNAQNFGGLFIFAYCLPTFFTSWFVGSVNKKIGKKKTAFFGFLLFNLFLFPISFISSPLLIILMVFCASIFISFCMPSLDGTYADYIHESHKYQREIQGLGDFSANIGYVIGPLTAGLISDQIGIKPCFSVLAAFNILLVLILLFITPKNIKVTVPPQVLKI